MRRQNVIDPSKTNKAEQMYALLSWVVLLFWKLTYRRNAHAKNRFVTLFQVYLRNQLRILFKSLQIFLPDSSFLNLSSINTGLAAR